MPDPFRRLFASVLTVLLLTGALPLASAQAASMTVAGTTAVNIRSCPALDCDVLAIAPVGSWVEAIGDPVGGFTPVSYGSVEGFAFSLYLTAPGQDLWFREGQAGCNRVALIFDIGMGFEPSQSIVETLVETGTAATMFPMGSFAQNQPDYVRMLNSHGFPIGTHGYDPVTLTELGPGQIEWDLNTSMTVIGDVIGRRPEPLFTPYAANSNPHVRSIAAGLGLLPVGWKVAATDYTWTATEEIVYNEVMNNVYDGAIIELHLDGPASDQSTGLALPRIITDLTDQGYSFVTIPEMILPCGMVASS